MKHKVIRAGRHSLAVIIPAKFMQSLGIKAGDRVELTTNTNKGTVNLRFGGSLQLLLPTGTNQKKEKDEKK